MARINGVSSGQAGLYIKAAYYFTRRSTAKLQAWLKKAN